MTTLTADGSAALDGPFPAWVKLWKELVPSYMARMALRSEREGGLRVQSVSVLL